MQTYAIGIGKSKKLDEKELEAIATKPENKFMVHDFDGLEEIVSQLTLSACEGRNKSYLLVIVVSC